jgi:hypothetical protein
MLDAQAVYSPEAVRIFNFFIGVDAPVYLVDDALDVTVVF